MPPGGRVFTSRDERVPGPAPGGTPILYTNDAAVADEWAGQLLSGGEGVLGFDIEWRPQFRAGRPAHRTALLQLATASGALCLHLAHMQAVPAKVQSLLRNPSFVKCGVGILDDTVKLARDWKGSEVLGRVDVGQVYQQHVGGGPQTACGIKALSTALLRAPISKPKKVSMSNWESAPLAPKQLHCEYLETLSACPGLASNSAPPADAALDAWVGYAVYLELGRRGAEALLAAARQDGSSDEEKAQVQRERAQRRAQKQREKQGQGQGKRSHAGGEENPHKKRRAAAASGGGQGATVQVVGSPSSGQVTVKLRPKQQGQKKQRRTGAKRKKRKKRSNNET